jgi:hypothetical protein
LTAKGAERNKKHKDEHQSGLSKNASFDNLAWILDQAFLEIKAPRNYEASSQKPKAPDEIISEAVHHAKPVQRDSMRPPPKPAGLTQRVRAAGAAFARFAKKAMAKRARRA